MPALQLTPIEARVIASLAEKSLTTPQYYPMTANAIMLAANQKNSRNPVMKLNEGDVGAALNRLQEQQLCTRDDTLGRVPKWRHQFQHQLLLQPPPFGLLLTLLLRGPQTVAELRANSAGLGGPADADSTAAAFNDLADRAEPLIVLLPRAPGQKEARYAHTLCGPPSAAIAVASESPPASEPSAEPGVLAALEEKVRALEARVAALEQRAG
jgi:hypothetical protein